MKKTVCATFIILSAPCLAGENKTDIYEMSLKDLMDVNVSIATTQEESYKDVFNSVEAVNENTWDSFGARNIFDTVKYVPGVQTYTSIGGNRSLSIRGYSFGSTGSQRGVAFLFDGIPVNDYAYASANYSKSYLPLYNFKKMEMIKGPISNIYGPDAFHGAISFTPWDHAEEVTTAKVSAGTLGDYALGIRNKTILGDDLDLSLIVNKNTQEDANLETENNDENLKKEHDTHSLFAKLRFNKTSLNLLINDSTTDDRYRVFFSSVESMRSWQPLSKTVLAYLKHKEDLGNNSHLDFSLWNHESQIQISQNTFDGSGVGNSYTKDTTAGVWARYYYSNEIVKTMVSFEYRAQSILEATEDPVGAGRSNQAIDGVSRNIKSLVLQVEDQNGENFNYIASVRGDYFSDTDASELSPKVGLSYSFSDASILKLHGSRGYRAPAASEVNGFGQIRGNESLKGETLESYELFHIYDVSSFVIKNTVFQSYWRDAITSVSIANPAEDGPVTEYANQGENEAYGYELDVRKNLENGKGFLFTNASYVRSKNTDTKTEYRTFPILKVNWGLNFIQDDLTYSIYSTHAGEWDSTAFSGDTLPNFQQTNLGASYKFTSKGLVQLNINNVLDVQNREPSLWLIDKGISTNGRNGLLTVKYQL